MNRIDKIEKSQQFSQGTESQSSCQLQKCCAKKDLDLDAGHDLVPKPRRRYETLAITPLPISVQSQILAGSVAKAGIQSAGHELGPTFDLSTEEDIFTSKDFDYEWNAGN